jgi:L-aspartate oxidase
MMKTKRKTITETDVLILGSGSAGLFFAIQLALHSNLKIVVITKKARSESNTNYAQGGIASVIDANDSAESHIHDTLVAGAGLCHEDAVRILCEEGPLRIEELMQLGANFTKTRSGKLDLGREGGHSVNRIVHAQDLTGREIERALLATVAAHPSITVLEDHFAVELLTDHQRADLSKQAKKKASLHPKCYGAYVLHESSGKVHAVKARVGVMLATGGLGQVYLHTTNPMIATGDGVAMAYRAGAEIGNMEFIQFHPTTLYAPEAQSFLISEAVRGAGAILKNQSGERFMSRYDPVRMELAPRDIVARAIDAELKTRGDVCVYLDISHLPAGKIKHEFPNIYKRCKSVGLDITKEAMPVVPAAHYSCGGVVTDLVGRTNIRDLYACGEVSMTGVHGANRLASNSLLEALVFSHRAAADLLGQMQKDKLAKKGRLATKRVAICPWDKSGAENSEEWIVIEHDKREVQQLLWDYVGIVRSNSRLKRAERRIKLIRSEIEDYYRRTTVTVPLLELRNIAEVALLVVRSALKRKESRGLQFTTDYPLRDDRKELHDTIIRC